MYIRPFQMREVEYPGMEAEQNRQEYLADFNKLLI